MKKKYLTPSFWFMRDNHTFAKPKGETLEEIKIDLIRIAKENPYGMVCPVTMMYGNDELGKVGKCCHVDGNGDVDLSNWLDRNPFTIEPTMTKTISLHPLTATK